MREKFQGDSCKEITEATRELLEKLDDPKEQEKYRKEQAEKRRKEFEEKTTCKGCNRRMEQKGSWSIGPIVIGGHTPYKQLFQCPECKTVKVI